MKIDPRKNIKEYYEEVAKSLVEDGFYKTKEDALKSVEDMFLIKDYSLTKTEV